MKGQIPMNERCPSDRLSNSLGRRESQIGQCCQSFYRLIAVIPARNWYHGYYRQSRRLNQQPVPIKKLPSTGWIVYFAY